MKNESNNEGWYASMREVARGLGVNVGTISTWAKLEGFPAKTVNGWPKAAVLAWHKARLEANAARHGDGTARDRKLAKQIEKLTEDIRKARAEANRAEQEERLRAGQLAEIEEVYRVLARMAELCAGAFERAELGVDAVVRDKAVVERVRAEFDAARHALADELRRWGGNDG